jgi:hypothetical protein
VARKHYRFSFIETNLLVGFFLSLIICTSGIRADSAERAQVELHQQELHQLFQNFFQDYLQLFPTFATRIGDHGYDDKLQIEISEEHRQSSGRFILVISESFPKSTGEVYRITTG